MFAKISPFVVAAAVVFTVGCSPRDAGPKTLVLDLDRVAAATGWDQKIKAEMDKKEQDLTSQVNSAKTNLETQLQALVSQFGDSLTEEQKTQLGQANQQASQQMRQLVASARQQNAAYRTQLVSSFQEKVRPYAEKIAEERGAGTVILKTSTLFFVAPESDITPAVIEALKGVTFVDTPELSPAPSEESTESAASETETSE